MSLMDTGLDDGVALEVGSQPERYPLRQKENLEGVVGRHTVALRPAAVD